MITVEKLSYAYKPGTDACLRDISLEILPGQYIALIGPNGCGKTTLLKHLNALLLPGSGEVVIDGMKTAEVRHHALIRREWAWYFRTPTIRLWA